MQKRVETLSCFCERLYHSRISKGWKSYLAAPIPVCIRLLKWSLLKWRFGPNSKVFSPVLFIPPVPGVKPLVIVQINNWNLKIAWAKMTDARAESSWGTGCVPASNYRRLMAVRSIQCCCLCVPCFFYSRVPAWNWLVWPSQNASFMSAS
jgi:hypothetical protein